MTTENTPYKSLLAGTFAGISSKLIEYPFDTLKVLSQIKPDTNSKLVTSSYKGLYRGVYVPVLFSSLENATMFYSYSLSKNHVTVLDNDVLKNAICGFISGITVSTILTPSELIKCKIQRNLLENKNLSVKSFVKNIYVSTGFKGFYKGHTLTMCREGFGTTVYFSVYETLKSVLNLTHEKTVPIWKMAIAGSVSGICYWTSIFPIDTIKSNFQTSNISHKTIIKNIYNSNGVFGFYRGYGITAFRAVISNFFIFYSYELGIRVL